MNTKTQTITAPDGYEIIRNIDENGNEHISFNKVEEKKEVSLDELKKKINDYRRNKKYSYYLNSSAEIKKTDDEHEYNTYNHNTESDIKAQQLNLIFKGLVEMYSQELDWENSDQAKWVIFFNYDKNKLDVDCKYYTKSQGTTYASSVEVLKRVVAEMGEENVIYMLKNLR